MCDIWRDNSKTRITPEDINKWAPEWKELNIKKVILCGEPLLHNSLWKICEILKKNSIGIELLTNGYLLSRYANKVLEVCDKVTVSLDGPESIHNTTRGIPQAFTKLSQGVRSLHNLNSSFPVIGRCAVHQFNFHCIRQTVHTARALGLSAISFLAMDTDSEEAFQRTGRIDEIYRHKFRLSHDNIRELEAELDLLEIECSNDFESGFICESPEQLRTNLLDYYKALNGEADFPEVICNAPWTSAVIEFNGSVRPCFFHKHYGSLRHASSLKNLLNADSSADFRNSLQKEANAVCTRCICSTATYRNIN